MPGTMVPRGNILYSYIIAPSLTPAAVAVSTSAEQIFTVQGLQAGDQISEISFSSTQTAGITITNGRVSAANSLAVQFGNMSAASATPAAGLYSININRPEIGPGTLPTTAA